MIRWCRTHSCGWYFPVHEILKDRYPEECRDTDEKDTNIGDEMYRKEER